MKVKTLILIALILPLLFSCSENQEEIDLAKKTVDAFYSFEKVSDYKSIDKLMSTRFYMTTPFFKFKEFLEAKKSMLGSFKGKELESFDITVSTNSISQVVLKYKVNYTYKKANESFVLEKNKNNFRILKYSIE
ncbi:MAG: hypothetical protein J0L86_16845 [Flavobacteriales bacterium]|nr:hypothetical protein [Flavobacteriales bacterium]